MQEGREKGMERKKEIKGDSESFPFYSSGRMVVRETEIGKGITHCTRKTINCF